MHTPAPILLIVFNRPDHTAQVLNALKNNPLGCESVLHVFSDAPRGPQDEEAVRQVRDIIRQASGFKEIIVHESQSNMGCSKSVLSAIGHVLSLEDRCIIVEDDILVAPLFLEYMNKALAFYENDEKIFSVSAYRPEFKMPASYKEDTYVLGRSCVWGWGTWKKAWDKISVDPDEVKRGLSEPNIRKSFAEQGEDWLRTFEKDPEIWDLRVSYGLWKSGLYTVMPAQSLTWNIGRDGSGVHYNGKALKTFKTYVFPTMLPELKHHDSIDENVRKAYCKFAHKPAWWVKATKIGKAIGIYDFLLRLLNKG
jgi:hypothetical protein